MTGIEWLRFINHVNKRCKNLQELSLDMLVSDDRGTAALNLFKTEVKDWLTSNSTSQFSSAGGSRKCTIWTPPKKHLSSLTVIQNSEVYCFASNT